MNLPNWSQISGGVDRVLLVLLTWLASKGYITTADVANYAALGLGVLGAVYAFYVNRNTNLIKQAASVPDPNSPTGKTVVITTPDIAAATPGLSNVVSSDDKKAVTK